MIVRRCLKAQAMFCRRRHQPSRPPPVDQARRGSHKRPDPPLSRTTGTCHPSLQGAKPVKRRFFLFWRHGCSAARNLPACKGKSLRCLRKCRFAYIDTSPALPARRHLTAALRPSRWHLGCQSHQTWCAPEHLGAAPCSAHPIQNFLPGTTVAIVGVRLGAWHAPGRRWNRMRGCALRSRRL